VPAFNWYWLADLCLENKISFVLGHALYLKAIHGGKTKSDAIDSEKLAMLLRKCEAVRFQNKGRWQEKGRGLEATPLPSFDRVARQQSPTEGPVGVGLFERRPARRLSAR
jgi:hypothetical protein